MYTFKVKHGRDSITLIGKTESRIIKLDDDKTIKFPKHELNSERIKYSRKQLDELNNQIQLVAYNVLPTINIEKEWLPILMWSSQVVEK